MNDENIVFHVFSSGSELDYDQLNQVYMESSLENSACWYPDLSPGDALKKYEQGHRDYLERDFFPQGGMLMVLIQGQYVSALRLYPQEPERYYMEALETRPDVRNRGFSKLLLHEMMLYLNDHSCVCSVRSHVSKRNLPSLRAHAAVGFHAEMDYVMEDGVRDGSRLSLVWDNSQISRICRFEKMLDQLRAPDVLRFIPEDLFRAELSCLEKYYTSRLWRLDFEADERGLLPKRLKRGVLSEDAVYHLLSDYKEFLDDNQTNE